MLGHRLITKQTPKEGILVKEVMVAEAVDIQKETYFCILMDRYVNAFLNPLEFRTLNYLQHCLLEPIMVL